ncbi:GTPase IMAP family member 5-like protein [Camelus ferus]|nr:GTPase IMAP family member 5-like protein [Camelus ferus]
MLLGFSGSPLSRTVLQNLFCTKAEESCGGEKEMERCRCLSWRHVLLQSSLVERLQDVGLPKSGRRNHLLSVFGRSCSLNWFHCPPSVFKSRLGAQTLTRTCQKATGTWNGRNILVVDTPSIFEAKAQDQETYEHIGDCYLLSAPGPHVLLLVTQLGRFTEQDTVAVTKVKEVFGAGVMRHTVILFTHKEDLVGESLDDYVANTDNLQLKSLVRECGRRYCAFNNRATGEEQREQLLELMAVIERLERELDGAFYTNDLFFDAQILQQGGDDARGEGHRLYLDKMPSLEGG